MDRELRELYVYRLIIPPDMYFKLLEEWTEKYGDPYDKAEQIHKEINVR